MEIKWVEFTTVQQNWTSYAFYSIDPSINPSIHYFKLLCNLLYCEGLLELTLIIINIKIQAPAHEGSRHFCVFGIHLSAFGHLADCINRVLPL